MAYYYVKNGESAGTAGGTTKQSGAFSGLASTATWGSIQSAIDDGGATSGDYICVSDLHVFTGSPVVYTGPTSGDFLYILTVEDGEVETAAPRPVAAQENPSADVLLNGRLSLFNLYLKAGDDIDFNLSKSNILAEGCKIEAPDDIRFDNDGTDIELRNCELKGADAGSRLIGLGGSSITMYGGSCTGYSTRLSNTGGGNGGFKVYLYGVDISSVTGTIFQGIGNDTVNDDRITFLLSGCKLNASAPAWMDETIESLGQRLVVTNTASTSDSAEYQFYTEAYGGNVEDQDDSGVHRDESTAYPGGEKVSLKCTTDANATKATPFWFDFPTRYAELSNAASDIIRIYVASSTTLYDSDVWAEAVYPDGTTKQLYNYLSTRHDNILDTNGTELTTDTGSTWLDGVSAYTGNEYYIDIDTSTDAGADSVPIIRVYVAKASSTIYFCTTLGLS